MKKVRFDPKHSALEKNPKKLSKLIKIIEENIGYKAKIVGILEIGSFAKHEAVPSSDVDLRIYVESPDVYIWQTSKSRFSDARKEEEEEIFAGFKKLYDKKPRKDYDWFDFNEPLAERITNTINDNVEFQIFDKLFTEFELENLDKRYSDEPWFLLQSNMIFDPENLLSKRRKKVKGIIYPPLAKLYKKRYLEKLPFEIYTHLKPHAQDIFKVKKSRQIQWVKGAINCLRFSVSSKTYINTGFYTYRKNEILEFYKRWLPKRYRFVEEMYEWKTDQNTRETLVEKFLANPRECFSRFKEKTKDLENTVKEVRNLKLIK